MSRENRKGLLAQVGMEVRMHQNAQDAFDEAACARLGINRSDARAIDILERQGQMSAGDLGHAVNLTSGTVTILIDRLERLGYVRRTRDTDDRRRVLVELTDLARARVWEIWNPVADASGAFLERYSDKELTLIRDFLRDGRGLLDDQLTRLRELPPPAAADDSPA